MTEAFVTNMDRTVMFGKTILMTSSGTATFQPLDGPDVKIAVRTNPVYYQWGVKGNVTPTVATAATQCDWLPQNAVVRLGKPLDASGIWILQDTAAATVFLTTGHGI